MTRLERYADVERLVLRASERLADDAEDADRLLRDALVAFGSIPAAPFGDEPTLTAARRLAAACEALGDRLLREQARVGAAIDGLTGGRAAALGYASAGGVSSFARTV